MDLLTSKMPALSEPPPDGTSFQEMEAKVAELEKKALRGEKHTIEEMQLIVAFFRARRERAFQAKPAKKRKTTVKRVSKKKQAEAEALKLLEGL